MMMPIVYAMGLTATQYHNYSGVLSGEEIKFQIQVYIHPHELPNWTPTLQLFHKNECFLSARRMKKRIIHKDLQNLS